MAKKDDTITVRTLVAILCQHVAPSRLLAIAFASAALAVTEVVTLALILPVMILIAGTAGNTAALPETVRFGLNLVLMKANLGTLFGALIGFIVLKNLASVALYRWQTGTARAGAISLANQLSSGYLNAPYEFHLQRKPAQYMRGLRDIPPAIWFGGGLSLCNLIADVAGVAVLTLALAVIEPLGVALAGCFLGALVLLNNRVLGAAFQRWGQLQVTLVHRLYQLGAQTFSLIKLVKVSAAERSMGRHISDVQEQLLSLDERQRLKHLLLQPISEISMLAAAIIVLAAALVDAKDPTEALPLIAAFAFAALRLMPALNRICYHLSELKFIRGIVAEAGDEILAVSKANVEAGRPMGGIHFKDRLELLDLRYTYPGAHREALSGLTLEFRRGEVVGIVGASGAGKSTLIDVLLGLLKPHSGVILADGVPLRRRHGESVGYVPQGSPVISATFRENIAFGVPAEEVDEERLRRVVADAQLTELVASLPKGLASEVGEFGSALSGGQKQRVAIARALYAGSSLIILDEATSDLDMETEAEIGGAVAALRGRATILIVAHRLHITRTCDRIAVIHAGRVVDEGTYERLEAESDYFRRMLHASAGNER